MTMYPQESGEAEAAFAAGMAASEQHQAHYQSLTAGQGSTCGDPLQADSEWQPDSGEQASVT